MICGFLCFGITRRFLTFSSYDTLLCPVSHEIYKYSVVFVVHSTEEHKMGMTSLTRLHLALLMTPRTRELGTSKYLRGYDNERLSTCVFSVTPLEGSTKGISRHINKIDRIVCVTGQRVLRFGPRHESISHSYFFALWHLIMKLIRLLRAFCVFISSNIVDLGWKQSYKYDPKVLMLLFFYLM